MKTRTTLLPAVLAALPALLLLLGVPSATAQTVTQTFSLRAGWNSIWLEVQPADNSVANVFAGLPLASVWTYVPNDNTAEFIRDQNELPFNQPNWLRYFPAGQPEAFLNNLFAVHAQRAYLVKLTAAATLTISGRPSIRPVAWQANAFNLRGFPVNPAQLPTFTSFFAPSTAHAGQSIYQLGANGQWSLVNPGDSMKSGEAYWTFCRGASTYQAPLSLELELGDGLDYDAQLTELSPRLRNETASARTVVVADLGGGASGPLSFQSFTNNQFSWVNLPAPWSVSMGPRGASNAVVDLRLAIRRKDFAGNSYASILEVKDSAGTRYRVPVTAAKLLAGRSSINDSLGGAGGGIQAASAGATKAGLWVGSATITNVNEANSVQPLAPRPTRSPFTLRLLVHVNADAQPRLLKEVVQMWQESTRTNDGAGNLVVDKPGRFVLLTDATLIPQFEGGALRGGQAVGRRLSTVDYDFPAGSSNYLAMTGTFAVGQTANCAITLDPNFPTNPFRHKFHPDHDNKDRLFQPLPPNLPVEQQEVYRVSRNVELNFSATDPAGASLSSIEYGDSVIGGTYRETILGLHKTNLVVSGTFRLTRVNNSPVLNQ